MIELLEVLKQEGAALIFATPRMTAALMISPFFGPQFIQGTARQVVILSLSLIVIPMVGFEGMPTSLTPLELGGLLAKEVALGFLIGFASGLVFWLAESVGFFIDNQRGSSMAEIFDPMSGSSSSPFGILFGKLIGVLFFVGGGFHAFLLTLYVSFLAWPISEFLPPMSPDFPLACLAVVDSLMRGVVLYAAPIVIAMFMAEFGLGLMSRFAPQLNVFFLAMPVKSGVAAVMIVFYLVFLTEYLLDSMMTPEKMALLYRSLFQ